MKRPRFLLLTVVLSLVLPCRVLALVLGGIGRPIALAVDDQRLYVVENARIHIHRLSDLSRIISIGRQGQGPGEFSTLPHLPITVDVSTGDLIVGCMRRISYFDKLGVLKREVRGQNLALRLALLDRRDGRDRFLGWSQRGENGVALNTIMVFDDTLRMVRELYHERDPFQGPGKGYNILPKAFSFGAHRGRVFIPGQREDQVDLLDARFNLHRTITVDQRPDRVGDAFRQQMMHHLRTSPETKGALPLLEPIRFPDFFPVVSEFFADQGVLYVMTWKRAEGCNEFHLFDLDGRFLTRRMIPIRYETDLQPYPTRIQNGVLYQLVENEQKQERELTMTRIVQ